MKIYILIAALLIAVCIYDANAYYKRVAKGGRSNGGGAVTYYVVSVHTDMWGTSIWCEGDGNNGCPYTASAVTQQESDARDWVLDQISQNVITGDGYAPNGKRAKWSASASMNPVNVNIWVWGISESLPSDYFDY
ncbi:MAG: hypothetical protein HYX66_09195 [Ignavibacteria bacterium]|nr:hypothetical protein [Ignavibacteria bacterium]